MTKNLRHLLQCQNTRKAGLIAKEMNTKMYKFFIKWSSFLQVFCVFLYFLLRVLDEASKTREGFAAGIFPMLCRSQKDFFPFFFLVETHKYHFTQRTNKQWKNLTIKGITYCKERREGACLGVTPVLKAWYWKGGCPKLCYIS